jgi:hypothetical protein
VELELNFQTKSFQIVFENQKKTKDLDASKGFFLFFFLFRFCQNKIHNFSQIYTRKQDF